MDNHPPDPTIPAALVDSISVASSVAKPLDLYSKTVDDIYDLLDVPEDKRIETIECTKRVYKECNFPDVSFVEIPKNDIRAGVTKLKVELYKIYPDFRRGEPWFLRWALWWEHTDPIPPPTTAMSNHKADDVYSLLRVSYRTRINIIQCTGKVYTDAGFQDVRFNKLPKDKVEEVILKLTAELRGTFPDSRRGEPWFARWALWRRHKTRPESRKKGKGNSKSTTAAGLPATELENDDNDDDDGDNDNQDEED